MDQNKINRVIISGGGTGGHLFPALAIAHALQQQDASVDLLFVGAIGKIEMERVPKAGYRIIGLDIRGLQRSFSFENLKFPFRLVNSLWKSKKIINDFKPMVALGVGGYASGPLLWAASQKGIPTLLQEQNSYPGITNKLLAKRAEKIFVAYDGMERFFDPSKIQLTGNPVRQDIANVSQNREEAINHFNLQADKKTIFITGGSGGAKTLNRSVLNHLDILKSEDVQVIWQTGSFYYSDVLANMDVAEHSNVKIFEFVDRMDLAYAAADVIVSRAGAGTISELCLVGKPVVLVPSPNVAEDHQTKNAMALVQKHAAILIRDVIAEQELIPAVLHLFKNNEKQQVLAENIKKMGKQDAAKVIAAEILKICANSQ